MGVNPCCVNPLKHKNEGGSIFVVVEKTTKSFFFKINHGFEQLICHSGEHVIIRLSEFLSVGLKM